MASTGALPQTLKSITATKINELGKQRTLFDTAKAEIRENAAAATDLHTRAQILLNGVSSLKGYPKNALDKDDMDLDMESSDDDSESEMPNLDMGQLRNGDHSNIRRFLLQGRYDSSISEKTLQRWIGQLENELRYLELKHDHASFYSKLVTEWLAQLDAQNVSDINKDGGSDSGKSETGFERVGRAEMHNQRAQWESLVFSTGNHVEAKDIRSYLDGLFHKDKLTKQAFKELRESVQRFGNDLATEGNWLDANELQWVSNALMQTDLLSTEKTSVLKEFMRNKEVTQEVADVLNMRLSSLESWSWSQDGIPVEMRRQLNGKYRVFMDEDLLDSLMLQYLGTKWAVELREVFTSFLRSRAWTPIQEKIPEEYIERRKYFYGKVPTSESRCINYLRKTTYQEEYFMSQLPESIHEGARNYDDSSQVKSALNTKHSLLHRLITESLIQKNLRGEFTAIRSDYKWFGPSLSHTTILTVLEYFGVSRKWLNFFKVFLEAPLRFVQDGPAAQVQTRKRGIPMSHTLSDFFGESVLFCMDYAVNQGTNGNILYRLHDDFWFWGTGKDCEQAWGSMTKFANLMGLEFNEEKTGTVQMGEAQKSQILPTGEIRWGFLVLDAEQGKFVIDQKQVDQHIEELDRQLSSCKSIFEWVQAWNGYFGRFFANNFAKPALCFGRDHIDMAISTLSRIESALFGKPSHGDAEQKGGVTNYLRGLIAERFDIHDLPEGFFYYPVELGGLELLNPFVNLLSMRENIKQTPHRRLQRAILADEIHYYGAREKFEKEGSNFQTTLRASNGQPLSFPSLEEHNQYPETFSHWFYSAYCDLIKVPEEKSVANTGDLRKNMIGLKSPTSRASKGTIGPVWSIMTPYWRWVAELYHDEMVHTYGSLAAVNREFMPLGVVKTLKEGRFRWQG
ncbi:hypothetical protein N7481_009415 [Penicillium waksmanii]|uniref:uncharacterized protein n=1 Tax=Penicillium waksmanii TaxID=69791 RepID=UPI002549B029|nr:uncharacterized protein N7481_009415 [Penicillium waksmanii]KAJ5975708.1 hypothetical protein N7481_009415 [Penicillium waksmanii]